jgi:hypothetical protein
VIQQHAANAAADFFATVRGLLRHWAQQLRVWLSVLISLDVVVDNNLQERRAKMKRALNLVMASMMIVGSAAAAQAKGTGNPTGAPGSNFATEHPRRNEANKRVENQRERINEGVKTGKLSEQQAQQLRANDRAIKVQEHAEVRANGGHLTPAQQRQLNQEENANSRLIHDEKHPQ